MQAHSAEGEIPYRLVPGDTLEYVDLSGAAADSPRSTSATPRRISTLVSK